MSNVPETITVTDDGLTLPVTEVLAGRGFITGKSGSGKSILEGTPVYTESGRKPIEAVEEGERVLSLNRQTYEQEFRDVLATIEHEADDLLRITLEDGTELVGTEDHSFLTVRDLEIVPIRGSEIEEGAWIPLSRDIPAVETVTQIDLAEYVRPANNVIVRDEEIQSGSTVADRYLDLTFDSGKVLGLYLAEGSLDSKYTVQISNVDDDVKAFLGTQEFKTYERTSNRAFKPFGEFVRRELGTGSANKRVPDWMYNAPREFKTGLLSGYFDGDGTVNDHDVTVMSKSPELLRGIKELLRHFGISSTIRDKMVLYGDEPITFERLTVDSFCLDRFAEVLDLSVVAKTEKLDSTTKALADGGQYNSKDLVPNFDPLLNRAASERGWTERESGHRSGAASIHNLTRKQKAGRRTFNRVLDELDVEGRIRQFGDSDIQWKRVATVKQLDEARTVYDLDVAVNDNFIANGAFVHNSNSASVVVEELLENNFAVLIIDTDGEYYGLKERYEILHVGAGPECDVEVGPGHAKAIAEISLVENVPVILDISAFLDADEGRELVREVVETLFRMEGRVRKPFLLVVEEAHEFLPESGGLDDLGELLVRVAKRGRKRGLGLCGISQRPAAVDKDFITQCDWLVWHRLTWDNDTRVVKGILGSDAADTVQELGDGEALLMTDWDDQVQQVQFRRKRTFDAGATPGLGDFERPELKSVGDDLLADLQALDGDTGDDAEAADHEAELKAKDDRIKALESKITELETEIEEYEALIEDRDAASDEVEFERGASAETDDSEVESDGEDEDDSAVIGTTDPVPGGDGDGLIAPLESILTPGGAAPTEEADVAEDAAVESIDTQEEPTGKSDDAASAAEDTADGFGAGVSALLDDVPPSSERTDGEPATTPERSSGRDAPATADGTGTSSARRIGTTDDSAEEGSVDPLWEIGELIIHLVAGVRRLLVGGTQAVSGSASDNDRTNVRPISGGTEEREFPIDRRTEGVLVILAIAAAIAILYLLVFA